MPRRKQDCPKRMKWDGEGDSPTSPNLDDDASHSEDEGDSTGSVAAADGVESRPPSSKGDENSIKDPKSPVGDILQENHILSPVSRENSPHCSIPFRNAEGSESATQAHHPDCISPMRASPPMALTPPMLSSIPPALMPLMAMASRGILPLLPSPHDVSSPSPSPTDSAIDFSTRKARVVDDNALNLSSKASSPSPPPLPTGDSPLDLSVPRKRPGVQDAHGASKKVPRVDQQNKTSGQWALPQFPFFAPNSISPKGEQHMPLWNGKVKTERSPLHSPGSSASYPQTSNAMSEAAKALEKMTELSKLGGEGADMFRSALTSGGGRPSAWQTHWLNKGAEQAKDVLKCVWCKQSFPSLAAMTTHMKEAKHCGVAVPPTTPPISSPNHHHLPQQAPSTSLSSKSQASDLNLLIKETMPLPRKLVRGQDVWLGKGAEQTRQILKCMWCGQSFRSLAEMTSHMQQTQHYTNIISQEQIISWRSSDDKSSNQSHVSAVLTCKVCDQAFSSLKELSNHMVKNAHYKEHIMRSITESGGRRRQTREKRKKSLPVRKLLELERAQNEVKHSDSKGGKESAGRITCEKCGDKIDTPLFVEHIRQCVGSVHRNLLKHALTAGDESPDSTVKREKKSISPAASVGEGRSRSSRTPDGSTGESDNSPSVLNAIEKLIEKSFDSRTRQTFTGTPMGSSILKRLGIDESVDYTKPLVDPQTMNFLRCYQQSYQHRERSGSESSAMSDKTKYDSIPSTFGKGEVPQSPRGSSVTPPSPLQKSPKKTPSPLSVEKSVIVQSPSAQSDASPRNEECIKNGKPEDINPKIKHRESHDGASDRATSASPASSLDEKPEPANIEEPSKQKSTNETRDGAETPVRPSDTTEESTAPSPCPSTSSERSETSTIEAKKKLPSSAPSPMTETKPKTKKGKTSSLSALSSMFESLSGAPSEGNTAHPLAALQKLCDKTETHASRPGTSGTVTTTAQGNPGAILAFSWACNDAVMTDSIMKCAFCDTPFISKGAYRHHLSKMHFVKDGSIPDPVPTIKSHTSVSTANKIALAASSSKSPQLPPPPPPNFEESPHSKFLKYTELAKQLSSKYV